MPGPPLLIYGSYGYSGALIVRRSVERGLSPVLAGRSEVQLRAQASEFGLEYRVAPLDAPDRLGDALSDIGVVLHCAGPFIRTSRPMADACLHAGAHYLDITGEIAVFEALAARDAEARQRGVMLLPGTGFDVVPTDCLAVHLARRLPGATSLVLAFQAAGGVSRGTATTIIENIGRGCAIRRDGTLVGVPFAHRTRMVNFGRGDRLAVLHPWGDLSTAWRSTGIPNIDVFRATTRSEVRLLHLIRLARPLLATRPIRRLMRSAVRRGAPGPDDTARRTGFSRFWGEARRTDGERAESRQHGPEGYTLTAHTAVACAERALSGDAPAGFATPAMAYGPDFILGIDGMHREDVS